MTTPNYKIHTGDCLEVLKEYKDNYFPAVVTDPPYFLTNKNLFDFKDLVKSANKKKNVKGFMNRMQDGGTIEVVLQSYVPDELVSCKNNVKCPDYHWVKVNGYFIKPLNLQDIINADCEGEEVPRPQYNQKISVYYEFSKLWAEELIRVMKPGAYLLAFSSSRTWHRLACALEDAGFILRDNLTRFFLFGCLDVGTECLTKDGWKKYDEITYSDYILQWDSDTNELSWVNPTMIHRYPYDGEMIQFCNRHTNQLVTPNHRVYAKCRSNPSKSEQFEIIEAKNIKTSYSYAFPLSGTYKGEVEVDASYAYLVGWWLTDAWPHQDGKACMFSQCKLHTLNKLTNALQDANCNFSEYVKRARKINHKDEHTFYVTGELANSLLSEYPKRELSLDVLEWNLEARMSLLEGLIDGDGTNHELKENKRYGYTFYSKSKERREIVQLLAMSLNYRTLMDSKKGCLHINPKTNTTEINYKHMRDRKNISYKGDVWCVTVPKGAFVVRRNENVFITGNSGFPKSHNISKSLDKLAGEEPSVIGKNPNQRKAHKKNGRGFDKALGKDEPTELVITQPTSELAKLWEGYGTALKPAYEVILCAAKPIEGTYTDNAMKHECGGLNVDECRIPLKDDEKPISVGFKTKGDMHEGWTRPWMDNEEKWEAYKSKKVDKANRLGRHPANVLLEHNEGCSDDRCVDDCAVNMLDSQKGKLKSCSPGKKWKGNTGTSYGKENRKPGTQMSGYGDEGYASRFFYTSKASKKDKGEYNKHETVKPTDLMRWLVRLVKPPKNGVILDLFMGSGSTGKACMLEGIDFIGIENEPKYVEWAERRLKEVLAECNSATGCVTTKKESNQQSKGLFD